jgi:HAD superfamily hydrolase (TIGR01549 family)
MKKVLIFDFDGTIVDSTDLIINIIGEYIPGMDRQKYLTFMTAFYSGKRLTGFFKIFGYQLRLLINRKAIKQKIAKTILSSKLHPGIQETLVELKDKGADLYIISSNFRENILEFLEKNKINVFDEIYGSGSIFNKAKAINQIKSLYTSVDQLCYVGDEIRDVFAARNANIESVSVTWGINSRQDFEKYGVEKILDKPEELLKLISRE